MSRLLCAAALRLPPSDFVIEWTWKKLSLILRNIYWCFKKRSPQHVLKYVEIIKIYQNSIQAFSNCCSEFPHVSTGLFDVLVRPLQGSTPPVDSGNSQGWFLRCRRCADGPSFNILMQLSQWFNMFNTSKSQMTSNDHLQSSQTFISVTVSVI